MIRGELTNSRQTFVGGTNARLSFIAPTDATYQIVANSYAGNAAGEYLITIERE